MAPRSLWTGSISFGLVNIPIRLYAATESHQIAFHQIEAKTGKRIHYKRVAEGSDREVSYDDIIDGYELDNGRIVSLTDEELAAAEPKKTRTLELEEFVALGDIDPLVWNHTYYVGPDETEGARKAYAVLRDAMTDLARVGVGRFVMRSKEYLATLRPLGPALALETMFFADEVRDIGDVPGIADAKKVAVNARERAMAKQLVESLSGRWEHGKWHDEHRERVMELIKRKSKGAAIPAAPQEPAGAEVVDLMEALKASLGRGASKPDADKKPSAPARGRTGSTSRTAAKPGRRTTRRSRPTRAAG